MVDRGASVPLKRVCDEDHAAVDHVPFIEREVIDIVWNGGTFRYTQCLEHRLLPVAASAFHGCDGIHNAESQDAFDGPGHNPQGECLRVILVPGLDVEGKCG